MQLPVFTGPKLIADLDTPQMTRSVVEFAQGMFFIGWGISVVLAAPAFDVFSFMAGRMGWTSAYGMSFLLLGLCFSYGNGAVLLFQEAFPRHMQGGVVSTMNVVYGVIQIGLIATCGTITRSWSWSAETLLWIIPTAVLLPLSYVHLDDHRVARSHSQKEDAGVSRWSSVVNAGVLRSATWLLA